MSFRFLPLLALVLSVSAHANPAEWLDCTTPGDALESVSLGINGASGTSKQILMTISDASGKTMAGLSSELSNDAFAAMQKQGTYQIIFSTTKSNAFGGATSDAILLSLVESSGTVTGYLAKEGTVYQLTCTNSGD